MNALLRALGFGLLTSLANRLPARAATAVQLLLVLAGCLLPLWPLYRGWIEPQDVLIYALLWMLVSVVTTVIRMRTLPAQTSLRRALTQHYSIMIGGMSLVALGVVLLVVVTEHPLTGGWLALIPTLLALVLSSAWSLADGWFARGGRLVTQPWQVLLPGYLRLTVVIGGPILLGFALRDGTPADARRAAVIIILTVTVIDLVLAILAVVLPRKGRPLPAR